MLADLTSRHHPHERVEIKNGYRAFLIPLAHANSTALILAISSVATTANLPWQQVAFIRDETAAQEICAHHDWLVGSDLDRKGNVSRRIRTCLRHSPGEIPGVLR